MSGGRTAAAKPTSKRHVAAELLEHSDSSNPVFGQAAPGCLPPAGRSSSPHNTLTKSATTSRSSRSSTWSPPLGRDNRNRNTPYQQRSKSELDVLFAARRMTYLLSRASDSFGSWALKDVLIKVNALLQLWWSQGQNAANEPAGSVGQYRWRMVRSAPVLD